MGHAAFYRYVKSKLHSFPAGSPLYGASQEFERCNKESEVFMRKRIITLLLGLMAATALLTVTAWAAEPPQTPSNSVIWDLIGNITLECQHRADHKAGPGRLNYTGYNPPFEVKEVEDPYNAAEDTYSYKLIVLAKRFVDLWDNNQNPDDDYDFHHWQIENPTAEFKLIYSYANNNWSLADITTDEPLSKPGITFRVSCAKPTLPTADDLKNPGNPESPLQVSVRNRSMDAQDHSYDLAPDMYDLSALSSESIYWGWNTDLLSNTWLCNIPLNSDSLIKRYQDDVGGNYLLESGNSLHLAYNMKTGKWFPSGYTYIDVIPAPSMDLLKSLGVTTVSVSCQDSTHDAKSFALTSFSQLSGSWVYIETSHQYEYRLTLTNAAVNDYLAQYSTAVDKTHTLDSSGYVALTWYQPGGGVTVYANADPVGGDPIEIDPDQKKEQWVLVGDNTFNITAACVPDTPQDNTTTTTRPRRKPAAAPVQADDTTISSAKTFDGGIALYAGLTLLSTTGAALLHRKKDN